MKSKHSHLSHHSAEPSHYNKEAESYDAFNEKNTVQINQLIEKVLKKYGAKTVLDQDGADGSKFVEKKSERIFMIAKKMRLNK